MERERIVSEWEALKRQIEADVADYIDKASWIYDSNRGTS
jgi:hypothetical protein